MITSMIAVDSCNHRTLRMVHTVNYRSCFASISGLDLKSSRKNVITSISAVSSGYFFKTRLLNVLRTKEVTKFLSSSEAHGDLTA